MFYPFLRPDELFAAQLPEEAVCSGGSSFFFVILEHLKKAELRYRVWYSPMPVGGCPLALALRESLLPLAKWLLTHVAVRDESKYSLLYATWSGNIEIVQWVIQHKLFEGYSWRWPVTTGPIDEALRTGHHDIATYLLDVACIEPGIAYVLNDKTIVELGAAKDDQLLLGIWSEQHTQLLEAVPEAGRYLNIEVTKVLYDHGIDLAPAFWSACAAVTTRSLEIIEYLDHLLDWEGAIEDTQDALDNSLYIALGMKGRKLELVEYLLSHGAQVSSMSTLQMFASKLMALESNTADEDVFFEVLRLLPYESWSWQDILMEWRLRGRIDPLAARKEELSTTLIKKCRTEHYGLPRVVGR
ncbi:hypothetical protein HDU88_008348 [Geranomyces variabilis]|nr:hypothetical protein HDU88_008348 [Geranomyces variabilis]